VLASTEKLKPVLAEKLLQSGNEFTPEHAAEHSHRQEEPLLRMNPTPVVWR
jgi:hypothetical protein